jgi:hypothetical protein
MSRRRTSLVALPLAVIAALVLGLSPVVGSIPSGGMFYGCYSKSTGTLRVIDPAKVHACPVGQRMISWNQVGPQGPKGDTGATGATGATGPQGPAGVLAITLSTRYWKVDVAATTSPKNESHDESCPSGKVTGAGFGLGNEYLQVLQSLPISATTWRVVWHNTSASATWVIGYLICMTTNPTTVLQSHPLKAPRD